MRLRVAEAASERYRWPLHVIEDAGDDPPIEQPEAFLRALHATLAERRGGRAMNYRLAYALGFHPWEDLAEHPPYRGQAARAGRSRGGGARCPLRHGAGHRHRQRGLGGATGETGLEGDRRRHRREGPGTRSRAREEEGVEMRLVHGDVTALSEAGIGSGFRLLLDTGTFHGLE